VVREPAEGMGGRLIAFYHIYHNYGEYHGAIISDVPGEVATTAVSAAA
jgi:hypothetical protein